jgi:hypothetical protein
MKLSVITLLVLCCLSSVQLNAQEVKSHVPAETSADVPALFDFHEVMVKLWHTAWPDRNIAMMVEALPAVKQFADTMSHVALPGILRDRTKVWKENTTRLQEIVLEYEKATAPVDTAALMSATEKLHSQFEKLIRITRPVLKEMDAFHQVLYMLYHHSLPEKDGEKVVAAVGEMKEKMAVLNKAELPERLQKKADAFKEARAILSKAVQAIDAKEYTAKPEAFTASIEEMHSAYQALEAVFD